MIFVTVGTQLVFPRLLDMAAEAAPGLVSDMFAQTADPAYSGPLAHVADMTRDEFEDCCARATLILGHAGMGTILAARRHAKPLIVVPRRFALDEHRNDHQLDTAAQLARGGEAIVCDTVEALALALAHPPRPMSPTGGAGRKQFIRALNALVDEALDPPRAASSVPAGRAGMPSFAPPAKARRAAPAPANRRLSYLGIEFDERTLKETADEVIAGAEQDGFRYVITPNTDHVITLKEDGPSNPDLEDAYRDAWLCLNDSRVLEGLAWFTAARLPVVTGSDLTTEVLARCNEAQTRVAIVGGDRDVMEALEKRYPRIAFSTLFPPHGLIADPAARTEVAAWIERTGAPIVFLAVGAPQSELICHQIKARGLARGVALCTGSGIAFASGIKARAPATMQRLRLEWLYRLLQEPRRLAPRYLVKGPRILRVWLRYRNAVR